MPSRLFLLLCRAPELPRPAWAPWPKPESRKVPVSVELKRRSMEDSGYPLSFDDLQYFRVGSEMALGLLLTRVIPMKCLVPRTRASTVPMLCYASLICRHFLSRFARGTKARKFNVLQHWTTRQTEGRPHRGHVQMTYAIFFLF